LTNYQLQPQSSSIGEKITQVSAVVLYSVEWILWKPTPRWTFSIYKLHSNIQLQALINAQLL